MRLTNRFRKQNIFFSVAFIVMIGVPLLLVNREDGAISKDENRYLAGRPHVIDADGNVNTAFTVDFENWINDNIGLRSFFVRLNAGLKYHVFGSLSSGGLGSSDFYLGPNGEFNYAEKEMLLDYQHKNLYTQEQLDETSRAYQKISDDLALKGIKYYYMQCRDKHRIYPEQFMTSVNQYGDVSLVDQVLANLKANTTVNVIDTTEVLTQGKGAKLTIDSINHQEVEKTMETDSSSEYGAGMEDYTVEGGDGFVRETFGRYTDPSHWTEYGAYMAYRKLMETFNLQGENKFRMLELEDYDLNLEDQGTTLYGDIHEVDMQEVYHIKEPAAIEDDTMLTPLEGTGHRIFKCDSAGNDDVLLIIGDSYIENYILDDIAESFGTTIFVWGDYSDRFMDFVELYKPTIVLNENAERCSYRFPMIVSLAASIE